MSSSVPQEFEAALAGRLRAVAPFLLSGATPPERRDPAEEVSSLLGALIERVLRDLQPARLWLLTAAVSARFPTSDKLLEGMRLIELAEPSEAFFWLLDQAIDTDEPHLAAGRIRIVTDAVVVDVDHSARHDLHTGIQRVVRWTLPYWERDHAIVPVAWTRSWQAFRPLDERESGRVFKWGEETERAEAAPLPDRAEIVIPWRTVVALPEVPSRWACDRLAALAQHSGNSVVAVGYDCIPALSADLMPPAEAERFARYLMVVKHTKRVAGLSTSATTEFAGFAHALPSQGLVGPQVLECTGANELRFGTSSDSLAATMAPNGAARLPLVLSVGSFEPRKNHLALLYASERLWREGHRFELLMIGGSGWGDEVPRTVARLVRRGRPIQVRREASEDALLTAYHRARFSVFASLHEGFGLPVAESLAAGTPVITADYGSTRQVGMGGGAVLIDPRDDEALVAAMRTLLTDDEAVRSLREQISLRPVRTWEEYASELWDGTVSPELAALELGVPA